MLIELPLIWLLVINSIAWFCIPMVFSYLFSKRPDQYYEQPNHWYEPFEWEKNGETWQIWLGVKRWKDYLPEGSSIRQNVYNKRHLQNTQAQTIKKFILETKRAEQMHWFTMLPAPLFFIWNPPWAGWLIILYALLSNVPFIIIQRYNRPRLQRIYKLSLRKESLENE